ncbi:hypothetical protein CYMTET_43968 [Cymbomonas tetramitiformis]|uniref:Uncharacterized protein n=1 Tax=Cymbomonas tetramitiformis TaxID=36881 RepID=A0AAE0C2E2_9CHLO|nr:hypothetical protein CYMTET_43968 [Cymbomonas tetramitiformis]
MSELSQKLYVEAATAEIFKDEPDRAKKQLISEVVQKRLPQLDVAFMAALAAYLRAAEARGETDIAMLLTAVRNEVQIVELLTRTRGERKRRAVVKTALNGGNGGDIPGCGANEIATAAGDLIDDMERKATIADWKLLMRLCVAREVARIEDLRSGRTTVPPNQGTALEMAVVKNLVSVPDSQRRRSLLRSAFEDSLKQDSEQEKTGVHRVELPWHSHVVHKKKK